MKSFVLLSVSSPLPPLTSAPEVMLSAVDPEFAFLSALWPAVGFVAKGGVSESTAAPKPSLSTTVTPASLYKMTLLSAAILLAVE